MSLTNNADEYVLLHNPHCSKSRATKALLEERGVSFRERNYLEDSLSIDELRTLVANLGAACGAWIRTGEAAFGERGLSLESKEDELFEAVAQEPKLLQRPVLIHGAHAIIGRPPEDVLQLLGD